MAKITPPPRASITNATSRPLTFTLTKIVLPFSAARDQRRDAKDGLCLPPRHSE